MKRIVCYLLFGVVVKCNQMPLPSCVGDSVCAMLQSGPSGVSSVGVCACPKGAECDLKWDEAQTRERDRWIRRNVNQEDVTEMYREGWVEEQFKYCKNVSTTIESDKPLSSSSTSTTTSRQLPPICDSPSRIAYTSYEFFYSFPLVHTLRGGRREHLSVKEKVWCTCPPFHAYSSGLLSVERMARGVTILSKNYKCVELPLCETDSVIHELSRSEFRSKGFIVSQKCRCPPGKRCPIKDIAYKYNQMSRGSVYFLTCSVVDS